MSLLVTRRAAEQLHRGLEGEAAGLSTTTASLVALSERLRESGTHLEAVAVPREDFRAALRTRLVAVATVQPVTAAPAGRTSSGLLGFGARGQKATGIAAGALASVVAVSGVAVASSQALPGDPFYGVKRTAEGLQLRLAGDDAAQGDRHLQLAATRLDEVRELAVGRDIELSDIPVAPSPDADWDRVRETLADMDADTRLGSTLLERVWREVGDAGVLTTLSSFASEQAAELEALLPLMAPEARGDAEASLGLVAELGAKSAALLSGTCTEQCGAGTSPSQPGAGGACDCADEPAPPQPSRSASPAPTRAPSSQPSESAPSSDSTAPAPQPSAAPAPPPATTPAPEPVPPLPTAPAPTPLPSELSPGLPTVAPSLPLAPAPVPVVSGSPVLDDLAPGGPGPLLPR